MSYHGWTKIKISHWFIVVLFRQMFLFWQIFLYSLGCCYPFMFFQLTNWYISCNRSAEYNYPSSITFPSHHLKRNTSRKCSTKRDKLLSESLIWIINKIVCQLWFSLSRYAFVVSFLVRFEEYLIYRILEYTALKIRRHKELIPPLPA